jgi:coenzyme F420-reducing hydrogenase delta subunit
LLRHTAYLAGSGSNPQQGSQGPSFDLLRVECPDAVRAGLLTATDASELFSYYYQHLNIFLPVLDSSLHTPAYCTETSPLLFTAVLTVACKVIRPRIYSSCLALANKLFAQAFEYGLCSIEVVQATVLLTHFKKAEDSTSWRKTGYAIRMAQELGLQKKRNERLPSEASEARRVLNVERTWLSESNHLRRGGFGYS